MTPHSFSCFLGSNAIFWWLESPWKLRLSSVKDIFNAYQAAETALGHLCHGGPRKNHGEKGDVSRDLTIKHGALGNKKRGDDGDIIRDIIGLVGKIWNNTCPADFPMTSHDHLSTSSTFVESARVYESRDPNWEEWAMRCEPSCSRVMHSTRRAN